MTTTRPSTLANMVRKGRWASLKAKFLRGMFPAPLFRWNRLHIERISLAGSRQAPPLDGHTFDVGWATPKDLDLLVRVRDKPEAFETSFCDGHWCGLGLLDGEPATMSWVQSADWHVSRTNAYRMKLPEKAGWHMGSFVREDLRGWGLYAHHTLGLLRMLRDEGLNELYCAVEADNVASRRAHERVGYERLFELRVLRLLGLTLCAVEDQCRPRPRGLSLRLGPWVHQPDGPEWA